MNKFLFTLVILNLSMALSAEESRFKLFTSKCATESAESLDTAPQSPPLNVDDPGTVGCNKWEFNFLVNGDITNEQKSWELPLLDIGYGIGDNLQLGYEVPLVRNQSADSTENKTGNSKVGVKYKFFEDEESHLEMAFYPQVEFVKAENSENISADASTTTTLPLLISKKLSETPQGDIMLTTNIAYNKSSDKNKADSAFFAAALGMPFLQKVSVMAELSTEQGLAKQDDIREDLVKANLGMMGSITKNIFLYGSFGESLHSSDHQNHTYVLTGLRFLSGGL